MPTLAEIRSRFRWDANALRWRNAAGRFVKESSLKRALTRFADNAGAEIRGLAEQLNAGEVTLAEWQAGTAARVKDLHLAMSAAARGGFHNLTQVDYGRIGARLRRQYGYLQRFALEIEAGRLSPAQIVNRSSLYGAGSNGAYEAARYDEWNGLAETGVAIEMRNVLGVAEHCEEGAGRPGCADESGRGWVPLGEMSLPGERRCLANCRCRMKYRRAEREET